MLEALAYAFLVSFTGTLLPGPMLAVTIVDSTKRGWSAGPLVVVGHMLPEVALAYLLWIGLGSLLRVPLVEVLIGILGAVALSLLGAGALREAFRAELSVEEIKAGHPVLDGFLTSALNPLFLIWWISIGPSLVLLASPFGAVGFLALYLTHVSTDFVWYSSVAYGIDRGRLFLGGRLHRILILICAVLLLVFAAYFVYFTFQALQALTTVA